MSDYSNTLKDKRAAMVVRLFSKHGGLELYAHKVVEGLLEQGLKVTVICENIESDFSHPHLSFYTFEPPAKGLSKADKIKYYHMAASEAIKTTSGFDIVHSQHLPVDGANVVTFHNHTTRFLSQSGETWENALNSFKSNFAGAYKLRNQYDRELCLNAKCLVFPASICQKDFYETYGLNALKPVPPFVIAPPGADLGNNPALESIKSLPDQPFTFLFVGRGFRKKGLDILLKACELLKSSAGNRQPFRLLIAGLSKRPLDSLRLAFLGLSDTVEYLGFQKNMAAVYAQSDVLVMPSRIEPFGMAPIQAMQYGIVPIVSKIAGVAEVLDDNVDSYILENNLDPKELAELMQKAMRNRNKLEQMSKEGLTKAQKLSWANTVEQTLKAYAIVTNTGANHEQSN